MALGGKTMGEQEQLSKALTDVQRRLVRDNVGLVAVHLRRNVVNLLHPKREREWDEPFQEGCLGLIRAAAAFRAQRGIPFAAFALARIRNAVSRALLTKFNTIYVPPQRPPHHDAASIGVRRDEETRGPKVFELSGDLADRATHRQHPGASPAAYCPTVGERLREKYERAVKEAAHALSNRTSTRGDRERLVRALVEERFLVPEEGSRRPLRHIAHDTRSSYGRVADCDKQLIEEIRRILEADPEFHALQKLSKTDPIGAQLLIDENLDRRLAEITAAEFTRRYSVAARDERATMLQNLLEVSPGFLEEFVQSRVAALPADARERLLRGH
jgi:hypothetical protein